MSGAKHKRWLTAEGRDLLTGWARSGLTEEQIAHNMGIAPRTLYSYKSRYPEIGQALAAGKEVADTIVENTLYRVINGYEYKETIVTNDGRVQQVTRYQKPDTTAIIFWLKNWRPERWRDRKDVELSGEVRSIFEELAKNDNDAGKSGSDRN